jgi:signal transduction histidine kinase
VDAIEAFTMAVAHDLREPLRAIDGYATALAEDHAARLPLDAQHLLDRLRAACVTLDRRVDGLMRLSRDDRSSLRMAPCDLAPVVTRIFGDLRRGEMARVVSTQVPETIAVYGDAPLLGIVIENLLSNAWKFTRERTDATIDVEVHPSSEADVVLAVRDNGIGFDMRQAHRLGLPFQRLHPAGCHEGTGIGLATTRRIVERHGGRLWADSAPGAGATFYVSLPSVRTR